MMIRIILTFIFIILPLSAAAAEKPRVVISTKGGSVSFKNYIRGISFSEIISGRRQNLYRDGLRPRTKRLQKKSGIPYSMRPVPRDTTRVLVSK